MNQTQTEKDKREKDFPIIVDHSNTGWNIKDEKKLIDGLRYLSTKSTSFKLYLEPFKFIIYKKLEKSCLILAENQKKPIVIKAVFLRGDKAEIDRRFETSANEVKVCFNLRHKYIVKYAGHFNRDDLYFILYDFNQGGDLDMFKNNFYLPYKREERLKVDPFERIINPPLIIQRNNSLQDKLFKYFADGIVKYFAYQLLFPISNFKVLMIIHNDIELSNVILSKNCMVKLGDFADTKTATKGENIKFDLNWGKIKKNPSPEMLLKKELSCDQSFKSDIWCLAASLWELATGTIFLDNLKDDLGKTLIRIKNDKDTPELELEDGKRISINQVLESCESKKKIREKLNSVRPECSEEMGKFFEETLILNEKSRLDGSFCLNHSFIKKNSSQVNDITEKFLTLGQKKMTELHKGGSWKKTSASIHKFTGKKNSKPPPQILRNFLVDVF